MGASYGKLVKKDEKSRVFRQKIYKNIMIYEKTS